MDVIVCGLLLSSGLVAVAVGLFRVAKVLDERSPMTDNDRHHQHVRMDVYIHLPEGNTQGSRFDKLEAMLNKVLKLEANQMAFAADVLAKITSQTTLIASIKVWIQNLPADVVSAEERAAILANLDTNSAELSTALPANTPNVG